jgi:hypothetical protein
MSSEVPSIMGFNSNPPAADHMGICDDGSSRWTGPVAAPPRQYPKQAEESRPFSDDCRNGLNLAAANDLQLYGFADAILPEGGLEIAGVVQLGVFQSREDISHEEPGFVSWPVGFHA